MPDLPEKIEEARRFIRAKYSDSPRAGIILGSGLGALINSFQIKVEIPYDEIPHFVKSTVEFHAGKLIFGELSGKPVVAIAVNHENIPREQIALVCSAVTQLTGLPATDVLVEGPGRLVDELKRHLALEGHKK